MKFFSLWPPGGQLREVTAPSSDIFVNVALYRRVGENTYSPHSFVDQLIPLDFFIDLVVQRLAILDAAAQEEEAVPA